MFIVAIGKKESSQLLSESLDYISAFLIIIMSYAYLFKYIIIGDTGNTLHLSTLCEPWIKY